MFAKATAPAKLLNVRATGSPSSRVPVTRQPEITSVMTGSVETVFSLVLLASWASTNVDRSRKPRARICGNHTGLAGLH